jgi:hypothetical protein
MPRTLHLTHFLSNLFCHIRSKTNLLEAPMVFRPLVSFLLVAMLVQSYIAMSPFRRLFKLLNLSLGLWALIGPLGQVSLLDLGFSTNWTENNPFGPKKKKLILIANYFKNKFSNVHYKSISPKFISNPKILITAFSKDVTLLNGRK